MIYYLHNKKAEKGNIVVVRTREICGTDRRCGWELRKLMMFLVSRGIATRHKQGVYVIEKGAIEKALYALSEQI